MLKSYFKTALRFLLKNKTYSFINIFGLAAGTLCCLYIVLYVEDQYSYDKHHLGVNDIYRVDHISAGEGRTFNLASTVAPIAPAFKREYPEVEQFTRVVPFPGIDKHLLRYRDKSIWETNAFLVDSTFFDVFTYHPVKGNPRTALNNPNTVVLLKPTADKLFGREDPVGKIITIDNTEGKLDYTVTGVVDESLGKSHLQANVFITMKSGRTGEFMLHTDSWTINGYIGSYVKLRPGTNVASLEKKFPAFVEKYAGEELRKWNIREQLYLQSISSIHTTPGLDNPGIGRPVNPSFLTILMLIAALIQIIACINFMNLSTARAARRAKEVGVRKVIGARRNNLVRQFLAESFLLALIGVLIALPLLILFLPYLNQITQSEIQLSFLRDYRVWLMLLILVSVTGLVAGSYPAFYLSAFQAIKVIKGNFTSGVSAAGIRKGLVVFQFVLSIVLISGIIIIHSQLNYIKNKDLGFDKDQRLVFTFNSGDSFDGITPFMEDLRKLAGVSSVSNGSSYISNPHMFSNSFILPGKDVADSRNADYIIADQDFVKTNGIKLVSGRDFLPTDSAKVLVNETFARKLGLTPSSAIGVRLHDSQKRQFDIVGVMKDFNYWSLHNDVGNFLVWVNNKHYGVWPNVTVHANTNNYQQLLSKIGAIWKKDVPGIPFEYNFLDTQVQKQYETDITLSRIINSFTLMAIVISGLGLFGLAAFSAEQRNKEIGIRKVLGASISGIVGLLSKDFLQPVAVAILIATPISWWAMNKWLQAFAFKVGLSWWMFAVAGLAAIVIALCTVSFQAIKAAVANPVKSLRAE
jgi:putative ABC transport system permease protein